jgi:hypothetical protein
MSGLSAGNPGIDPLTGYPFVMDAERYKIHAGEVFRADVYFDADSGLVLVTTDTLAYTHMTARVESQDAGVFEIFETCTTSSDGSEILLFNAKRTSTDTLTVTVTDTPTMTDWGTQIEEGAVDSGGSGGRGDEWILKQGTKYLVKFTPDASAKFVILLELYEYSSNRSR